MIVGGIAGRVGTSGFGVVLRCAEAFAAGTVTRHAVASSLRDNNRADRQAMREREKEQKRVEKLMRPIPSTKIRQLAKRVFQQQLRKAMSGDDTLVVTLLYRVPPNTAAPSSAPHSAPPPAAPAPAPPAFDLLVYRAGTAMRLVSTSQLGDKELFSQSVLIAHRVPGVYLVAVDAGRCGGTEQLFKACSVSVVVTDKASTLRSIQQQQQQPPPPPVTPLYVATGAPVSYVVVQQQAPPFMAAAPSPVYAPAPVPAAPADSSIVALSANTFGSGNKWLVGSFVVDASGALRWYHRENQFAHAVPNLWGAHDGNMFDPNWPRPPDDHTGYSQ